MLKRGEIYWVDLDGNKGSEQSKTRPCIIIQNDTGNKHSPTTIVAILTTKNKNGLPTHCKVKCDKLSDNSTLSAEQIRTIDKSRIKRYIGKCENMEEVNKCLRISLGL